jgi:hypothetical protein
MMAAATSASARSRGDRRAQRLLAIEAARALGEDAISQFRTQTFYIHRMWHPSVSDSNGARETGYKI